MHRIARRRWIERKYTDQIILMPKETETATAASTTTATAGTAATTTTTMIRRKTSVLFLRLKVKGLVQMKIFSPPRAMTSSSSSSSTLPSTTSLTSSSASVLLLLISFLVALSHAESLQGRTLIFYCFWFWKCFKFSFFHLLFVWHGCRGSVGKASRIKVPHRELQLSWREFDSRLQHKR